MLAEHLAVGIDEARPLWVHAMRPQDDMGLHHHTHAELVLIEGGRGTHRTREGAWPLRRGDVFLIPVGMAHAYADCRDLQLLNILFDPARLELPRELDELPGYRALVSLEPRLRAEHGFASHLHLGEVDIAAAAALGADIEAECGGEAPGWLIAATASLARLLVLLARRYAAGGPPQARALLDLAAVLQHLERHLADPLRVAELAAIAAVSERTLQRRFQRAFGQSVADYLIARRLRVAAQRLRRSTDPVGRIARDVGFADAAYFARRFRVAYGCSPREWRG